MTLVGAIGGRGRARVDGRGAMHVVGERWSLDWWIGADDRWRVPAREPAVRQGAIDGTPVLETALRVPGGDAIQRVYGIGGPGGIVIVEIENDSPGAFIAALTIAGARSISVAGSVIEVEGRPALVTPFAAARWSLGTEPLAIESIGSETGPFPGAHDRRSRLHAAFLYPLSHRSRLRVALATSGDDPGPVDLVSAASAVDAASGWHAMLDHGMRVTLPDAKLQESVDLARAQLLLDPDPSAVTTAALEDWGHDTEAAWAWRGLSLGGRRAARRRDGPVDDSTPGGLLTSVRRRLVRDARTVEVAPDLQAWWGQDLEVHDAPTRFGRLSYAIRWHGDRPALLWEVADPTSGLTLTAPGLDPAWSTTQPRGDALLTPTATASQTTT